MRRNKRLSRKEIFAEAASMVLPALFGVAAGIGMGFVLSGPTLTHTFGFFVIFLALYTLSMMLCDPDEIRLRETGLRKAARRRFSNVIGVCHGFFGGLLGISGGIITTPLLQVVLGTPVRAAITISLLLSSLCCGAGGLIMVFTTVKMGNSNGANLLFVCLASGSGALVGALIGAKLRFTANNKVIRLVFIVASLCSGLSIVM